MRQCQKDEGRVFVNLNTIIEEKRNGDKVIRRGRWTLEEDALLIYQVEKHSGRNWNLIAGGLHGRSGKQCRLRWYNQLDPKINKEAFSQNKKDTLLAAQKLYGNKWSKFAKLFPGRTDNSIKNQFHLITAEKRESKNTSVLRRRERQLMSIVEAFFEKEARKAIDENFREIRENEASFGNIASSDESRNITTITTKENYNLPSQYNATIGSYLVKGQEQNLQDAKEGCSILPNVVTLFGTRIATGPNHCHSFGSNLEAYQSTYSPNYPSDEYFQ